MGFPEVTTNAILLDETRTQILLIKWKDPLGQRLRGFPRGHIRTGEEVKAALVREGREETEYEIEVARFWAFMTAWFMTAPKKSHSPHRQHYRDTENRVR